MLINCPKCGFSQPNDRYCASCGVDMVAFRPAPPPFWRQLMGNPAFLIALTFATVMASVLYIRKQQNEELASRAELIRSGPVIVQQTEAQAPIESSSESDGSELRAAATVPPEAESTPPPAPLPAAAPPPAPVETTASARIAANGPAAPAVNAEAGTANRPRPERKLSLTAVYAEVSQESLHQLLEEAQTTRLLTDFGDFKSGPVADVSARLNRDRGVKVLHRVNRVFDGRNSQQQWFVGNKTADDQEVGLTTLVMLDLRQEGHVRGEVEVLRSFFEGPFSEGVVKRTSPISNFDIPVEWGWMISIDLPREARQPFEDEIGLQGLLRLFKSDYFKSGRSKFTLFLDFDSPTP